MTKSKTLEQYYLDERIAINNANKNEEIKGFLAKFGYTDEVLQQGLNLFNAAYDLYTSQKEKYGDQYEASGEVQTLVEKSKKTHILHRKLARIAFREDPFVQKSLLLHEGTKTTLAGWLEQAKRFYNLLTKKENLYEKFSRFLITKEALQAELEKLGEIENLKMQHDVDRSHAQQATKDRDDAIEEYGIWRQDFDEVARIALEEKPELIEMLKIVEPS